jgi:outer membrane cobalamin receptor
LSGVEFSYKKSIKYADININYTYLYSENNSDTSSDKLEYRPEHSANIVLNKNYIFGFGWRLETYYTGKRYGIDGDTKAWKSLADFTIFNIRLSQNIFNNYDLILRVNNLTDKYYEVEYGFPMQGRNINLGIEAHL